MRHYIFAFCRNTNKWNHMAVFCIWFISLSMMILRWRIDAFELWCWRRLLRVPWTARRSNQSILKEISPGCSLEGHWNSSTLATSCEQLTHWKRLWCWEGLGAGGEGDDRGWDGWMTSPTRWTWVWVNSGSWWWTGRPGMLQFMGLQRVGQDWVAELNWWWFLYLSTIFYINSALLGTLRRERKYKWQFVYPLTR